MPPSSIAYNFDSIFKISPRCLTANLISMAMMKWKERKWKWRMFL